MFFLFLISVTLVTISVSSRTRDLVSVARKRAARPIQKRAQTTSQAIVKKVVAKKWEKWPKTSVPEKIADKK